MNTTATLLIIRDGAIKMRLPLASVEERRDGSLWIQGSPLLDAEASGNCSREELSRLTEAKQYASIPAACFAHRGENPSGLLILTADEWAARQPPPPAFSRLLTLTSSGRIVLAHDAQDDLGSPIEAAGCRWAVTAVGKSFARGGRTVRYAYLSFVAVVEPATALTEMSALYADEEERAGRAFERMMEDAGNDGARPPRLTDAKRAVPVGAITRRVRQAVAH